MNPILATRRVWAIVPAAGRGARFTASAPGSAPKQYAPLLGATVLEWSLRALLAEPRVHAVVVALAVLLAGFSLAEGAIRCPSRGTESGGGTGILGGSYQYSCVDGKLTLSR